MVLKSPHPKASKDRHHRFGDLYRWLNPGVLRVCFYQLRKDAASGVDGESFQEYERNLEANLADLVDRLKRKAYRARLVRRKYAWRAYQRLVVRHQVPPPRIRELPNGQMPCQMVLNLFARAARGAPGWPAQEAHA